LAGNKKVKGEMGEVQRVWINRTSLIQGPQAIDFIAALVNHRIEAGHETDRLLSYLEAAKDHHVVVRIGIDIRPYNKGENDEPSLDGNKIGDSGLPGEA